MWQLSNSWYYIPDAKKGWIGHGHIFYFALNVETMEGNKEKKNKK